MDLMYIPTTVVLAEGVSEDRLDPAFYVYSNGAEEVAYLHYKDRTIYVDRVGEMYLAIPEVPKDLDMADDDVYNRDWPETLIRYTNDLEAFGITNDEELRQLDERFSMKGYEIWHNNAWFEVYSDNDDFGYDVYHDWKEAVEFAKTAIRDDEYWERKFQDESELA